MKKLPRPGFGIRLLSSLLCIILFLSMLAGILIADIRIITTKENTSRIIRESLFISHTVRPAAARSGNSSGHGAALHLQPKLSGVKLAEEESSGIMTEAMVEFIYNSMTEQYGELPVTLEDVEAFIEESTLQDELSDLSASLINDFITGENTTVIDEEMITDLVMENADLIEDYFGVTVDEAAVSQMASSVVENEMVAQIQEDGIANVLMNSIAGTGSSSGTSGSQDDPESTGSQENDEQTDGGDESIPTYPTGDLELLAQLNQMLEDMRTALSAATMRICFSIAALCVILLCALNRNWIWYAMRKIGFTLIWSALPLLIPTVVVLTAPETWNEMFVSMEVVGTVIGMILNMTAPVCIGVAAGGLALIIGAIVVKIIAKKRLNKPAATADAEISTDVPTPGTLTEAPAQEAAVEETEAEEMVSAEETPAGAPETGEIPSEEPAQEVPVE